MSQDDKKGKDPRFSIPPWLVKLEAANAESDGDFAEDSAVALRVIAGHVALQTRVSMAVYELMVAHAEEARGREERMQALLARLRGREPGEDDDGSVH